MRNLLGVSVFLAFLIAPTVTPYVRAADLPTNKIVLFSSGVGYFQRDGEVEGDATVELTFKADQINDLLKSMILMDFDKGKIAPVTYGSRDPITRTLKSFAVDITDNPSLSEILNRLRGVQAEISATSDLKGNILGVEKQRQQVKDEIIEIEVLNILTDQGIRSVPLTQVQRVKILDEKIDAELRKALVTLAGGLDNQRKPVTLSFTGKGKRNVRVAYLQETPIWKTSYRLDVTKEKESFLQGWAIVENTTDEDWKGVSLSLVSGRPISFIQDLYQSLYVQRPVVKPKLYESLVAPEYAGAIEEEKLLRKAEAADRRQLAAKTPAAPQAARMGRGVAAAAEAVDKDALFFAEAGVSRMAEATQLGELFQYKIDVPVTLARQKSAMLPIVTTNIEGEKLSIYNQNVHPKYALNGLKLKNTSGVFLMQGPITVFDDNAYAGDARIEDLPPGDDRLISYAVDLATEVEPRQEGGAQELLKCRLYKGQLVATRKSRDKWSYTAKSKSDKKRMLLIEHPFRGDDWKLIAPEKPAERTQQVYRFRVELEPRKTAKLEVIEERQHDEWVHLTNANHDYISVFIREKVVSQKVKDALAKMIQMREALSQTQRRVGDLDRRINEISQEQTRIRENMKAIPQNSEVYKRYLTKFDTQETEIEQLRKDVAEARADQEKQQKGLDAFLMGLEIE